MFFPNKKLLIVFIAAFFTSSNVMCGLFDSLKFTMPSNRKELLLLGGGILGGCVLLKCLQTIMHRKCDNQQHGNNCAITDENVLYLTPKEVNPNNQYPARYAIHIGTGEWFKVDSMGFAKTHKGNWHLQCNNDHWLVPKVNGKAFRRPNNSDEL